MIECPECGDEYTAQGLWGHLSMGEGLSGEELERAYHRARYGDPSGSGEGLKQPGEQGSEQPATSGQTSGEAGGEAAEIRGEEPEPETRSVSGPPEPSEQGEQLAEVPENRGIGSRKRSREQRGTAKPERRSPRKALDWLQRAKSRLELAEEEIGERKEVEVPGSGGAIFGTNPETEVRVQRTPAEEELCETCRQEVEEARKALRYALERRDVEHRHTRGSK